jgi:DNA-binding winged helix-turn-helix (wHTH) protein
VIFPLSTHTGSPGTETWPAVEWRRRDYRERAYANAMKIAFGDFVLDLGARQLLRGTTLVALEPKMYKLLEILIKRRPAVIPNEELDELIWPHVFVARTSLLRLVSGLRSALDDDPKDSKIIRTAYKTGYAFCAKTTAVTMTATPQTENHAAPASIHVAWKGRLIPLNDGDHIAGRGEECTLVIEAVTVSRRHARITVNRGTILIEDLGSTNGTHVNGVRISSPTPLTEGARIELGSESLQLHQRNASALTVVGGNNERESKL